MPTLHWLNDEEARKTSSQLPYRLLEADTKLSYGDLETENMLIQGDNLEALKALLPYYAGQVKCIYIDPPYNTQSAFEHYDDNLEHSTWLSMMYPRLEMLRDLLAEEGSIWISVDDNEGHYLKVLGDDIFGRSNFITSIIWQKKYTQANDAVYFSDNHDFILVYAKHREQFVLNPLPRGEKQDKAYRNPDGDSRGNWKATPLHAKSGSSNSKGFKFTFKNGVTWSPPVGTFPRFSEDSFRRMDENNEIWFGQNGKATPSRKTFLESVKQGISPKSIWLYDEVGHNHEARTETKLLIPDDPFGTPKPERLMQRIITLATNPNDIVLDSFLGSGTTAAVAHKMGRRYIGIEMGNHSVTHCAPRLKKVIDGEQGGISKEVNWQGGGGFIFYHLGEAVFDEQGRINSKVKFKSLAAHVWFSETHTPLLKTPKTPLLGVQNETAFYLLYNGILGDKTPEGGNVLTARVVRELPKHKGKKVIYGEMCMLDEATLQKQEITFKHIPYDIKAR